MKVVSWNCKRGLNSVEKYDKLLEYTPDLAIIQECYHPDKFIVDVNYKNFIWAGTEKVRGLGLCVLSFSDDYQLALLVDQVKYEWVVPIKVSGKENFTLIAVWTKRMAGYSYGSLLYSALKEYEHLFQEGPVVIMGDFNIDKRVTSSYSGVGFKKVVDLFESYGLKSCYHVMSGEEFGSESQATYYHHRKTDKPFHIDYCLVSRDILHGIESFNVGTHNEYLPLSDHMPLSLDFSIGKNIESETKEQEQEVLTFSKDNQKEILTPELLIERYQLKIDDEIATAEELKEAFKYIKSLRIMKSL